MSIPTLGKRLIPLVLLAVGGFAAIVRQPSPDKADLIPAAERTSAALRAASVPFVENRGQTDPRVAYYTQTFAGTAFITLDGAIVYAVADDARGAAIQEELVGSNAVAITAQSPASALISSYVGSDPSRWQSQLASYQTISLGETYPGIEVKVEARARNIEKIFHVAPGADPSAIRVRVRGAERLNVDDTGRLAATTAAGVISFSAPIAYQDVEGSRRPVGVAYVIEDDTYAFALGDYDLSRPLVIDPTLASTFLGGSGDEITTRLGFDAAGNIFVGGSTASANLPGTLGAYDPTLAGGTDAFLAKLSPDLSTLHAVTYFGSSIAEHLVAFTVDGAGNVFLAISTTGADVPITAGAYQSAKRGLFELAIAKFDNTLGTLMASTYLGGSLEDGWCCALAIATDAAGNVFVNTLTTSTDYPTTVGAYDRTYNDFNTDDAVVSKLNNGLTSLLAGTYIGGSLWDVPYAFHIDAAGKVWIGGRTSSSNYPVTAGAFHGDYADAFPHYDGFISRLSNNLATLEASTYIGSTADLDILWDIETAADGSVYATGSTESSAFPTTTGAYDRTYNGGAEDGVIVHFNSALTTLLGSTFFGGSGFERTIGVTVDGSGQLHVTTFTQSNDIPTTPDALAPAFHAGPAGSSDGVYALVDANLTALIHSSYIGGSANDILYKARLNAAGDVMLVGTTTSADFPATAYDTSHNGALDAFVMRYGQLAPPNSDPVADAGADQSVSCDDDCDALVTLDGSSSSDEDEDALTYEWSGPFGTASGISPVVLLGAGTHVITLTVGDGNGGTSSDDVTITVSDTTAPAFATSVGPFTLSVTDLAGTPFVVPLPEATDNCVTVMVTSDAPATFPLGATTVTFTATDAAGNAATASTTVSVVNTLPMADSGNVGVPEDGALPIMLSGSDADGHGLSFSVTTPPSHGTLTGTAPSLIYTPHADYHGGDSLEFAVNDGFGGTATATILISVASVNDSPTTGNVSVTTQAGDPVVITLTGSDIDSATLTFEAGAATGGTVSGTSPTFTFVPAPGFSGQGGFSFIVLDGDGGIASGVVTVTVTPAPPPPPPPPPGVPTFDSIAEAIGGLPGLNHGQRTSLLARLRNAQRAFERGHVDVAVRDLQHVAEALQRFAQTGEALDIVAMIQALAASIAAD